MTKSVCTIKLKVLDQWRIHQRPWELKTLINTVEVKSQDHVQGNELCFIDLIYKVKAVYESF